MIENDNIATTVGDVIYFITVPMLNIQSLVLYTDDTTGETGIRFFNRNYQFSLDGGVTWSDWINLDNTVGTDFSSDFDSGFGGVLPQNITAPNQFLIQDYQQLVLKFSFTRAGTDPTGDLQINSVQVNGSVVERGNVFTISSKGLFSDVIFNNINVMNLMVNLAQKMYEQGIVPTYLTRREDEFGFNSDAAYVDFWEAVAYFYAIISIDSIKFENVYWRRPLLCEFLRERNIFLCDCTNHIEMQQIAQAYYTEMRSRGTEEIFKPKGYQYPVGYRNAYSLPLGYVIEPSSGVFIDGEIYKEEYTMPFGWTVQSDGATLVAADRNYHQIFFIDGNGDYTVAPPSNGLLFPTTQSEIKKIYNGEYLRLICYNSQCDEFIYNLVSGVFMGWCLDNASPCYQGLRPQRNKGLLKAYEKQAAVQDLSVYPIINPGQVYIGVAPNPHGVTDTVMYLSSNGFPCYADVLPQLLNVTKHLVVNLFSTTGVAEGVIKITNLITLDEFDVPISLVGQPNFQILTDVVSSRYSVQLIFGHTGTMVSNVSDGAALNNIQTDVIGSFNQIYDMSNVQTDTIYVTLNFS